MNRPEVFQFLKSFFAGLKNVPGAGQKGLEPFLELVLSLKQSLISVPLLRDLANFILEKDSNTSIKRKIDRRYKRLCRVQEELGRLDLKKAVSNKDKSFTLEDYVFSRIDFGRYRKMDKKEFEGIFPEALTDFDDSFFKKNFSFSREEIRTAIVGAYGLEQGAYLIKRETPLVLSVMRALDTSLESSSLFSAGEIGEELKKLLDFAGGAAKALPGTELLYPLLVSALDNRSVTHEDGMITKLFLSPKGDLSGTFRPADKAWTLVLIKNE